MHVRSFIIFISLFTVCLSLTILKAKADDNGCSSAGMNRPVKRCFDGKLVTYWFARQQIAPSGEHELSTALVRGADAHSTNRNNNKRQPE